MLVAKCTGLIQQENCYVSNKDSLLCQDTLLKPIVARVKLKSFHENNSIMEMDTSASHS